MVIIFTLTIAAGAVVGTIISRGLAAVEARCFKAAATYHINGRR
jgi:hypothetical protein